MTGALPELSDSLSVDAAEVTRFLALRDPGFFDHEYRRNRPELSVFIHARHHGRLVGTQGLVPYPLMIGGRPFMSGRTERAMVDPMWRTGGLFAQLMRSCAAQATDKGHDLLWGNTGARAPFQRNGFLFFTDYYEHALLCLAPRRIVADLRAPQPRQMRAAKLAIAVPSLSLRVAARGGRGRRFTFVSSARGDRDVDQLYRSMQGKVPLVVMRHEPAFLDWLLHAPGRRVERVYVYDGATLAAYAYVDLAGGTTATLVDFAARDAGSMRALIQRIARDLGQRGVAFLYVSYNVTNPLLAQQRRWLVLNGFVPFHRGGAFVVRALRFQDYNYLNDLSRWYITRLWNEL
jgi:hypothetical protein